MNSLNKKVDNMATLTYNELDNVIKIHGQESFKDLILILIEIFESLDKSISNEDDLLAQNKALIENHERLLAQFEKERLLRKEMESRLFINEEIYEDQKRDYEEKIQNLKTITNRLRKISQETIEQNESINFFEPSSNVTTKTSQSATKQQEIKNLLFEKFQFDYKNPIHRKPSMKSSKSFEPSSSHERNDSVLDKSFPSNDSIREEIILKKIKKQNDKILVTKEEIEQLSHERNKYKEELLHLRESIAHMETIRAYKFDLSGETNTQFSSHNSSIISCLSDRDEYSFDENISFSTHSGSLSRSESFDDFVDIDEKAVQSIQFAELKMQNDKNFSSNPFRSFAQRIFSKPVKSNGWPICL